MPVEVKSCGQTIGGEFSFTRRLTRLRVVDLVAAVLGLLAGAVLYSRSLWFALFFVAVALFFVFRPRRESDEEPGDFQVGRFAISKTMVVSAFLLAVFLTALAAPLLVGM